MERELFFSGYCRVLDHSRMVAAVLEGTALLEVDCGYGRCPYQSECSIAQRIDGERSPAPG